MTKAQLQTFLVERGLTRAEAVAFVRAARPGADLQAIADAIVEAQEGSAHGVSLEQRLEKLMK